MAYLPNFLTVTQKTSLRKVIPRPSWLFAKTLQAIGLTVSTFLF
ncbi:MAG: hypothetical protein U1D30_18955 [Planctomycetota bacterium]